MDHACHSPKLTLSSITLLQSNICRVTFSISCQAWERLASSTERLKLAKTCNRWIHSCSEASRVEPFAVESVPSPQHKGLVLAVGLSLLEAQVAAELQSEWRLLCVGPARLPLGSNPAMPSFTAAKSVCISLQT